jgi:hypothetical protein
MPRPTFLARNQMAVVSKPKRSRLQVLAKSGPQEPLTSHAFTSTGVSFHHASASNTYRAYIEDNAKGWRLIRRFSALGTAPPEHEFQPGAVRVGAGHPLLEQLEPRGKAALQFFAGGAEGRAVAVRDKIVDGEELARRL